MGQNDSIETLCERAKHEEGYRSMLADRLGEYDWLDKGKHFKRVNPGQETTAEYLFTDGTPKGYKEGTVHTEIPIGQVKTFERRLNWTMTKTGVAKGVCYTGLAMLTGWGIAAAAASDPSYLVGSFFGVMISMGAGVVWGDNHALRKKSRETVDECMLQCSSSSNPYDFRIIEQVMQRPQ